MKANYQFCLFALLVTLTSSASEPQWQSLFDGKSLDGWAGNTQRWRVENGCIVGEIPEGQSLGKNEFIYSATEVADFELSVEYRISGGPSANSGVQIRSIRRSEKEGDWQAKGYQCDLDDGAVWLGRIYEEEGRALLVERGNRVSIAPDGRRWTDPWPFATPESYKSVPKKADWNLYEVSAKGPHIEARVNGKLFSVLDDHQSNAAKYAGKLAFQLHSGKGPSKIEFRNIRIKYLGKTEVPAALATVPSAPAEAPAAVKNVEAGKTAAIVPVGANGKALNLNFETGTLEGWKAEGDAWEGQPIKGDTVTPRKPSEHSNHAGTYWIGGYEKVFDKGTGTLTSEAFEVTHPFASFLVGGGKSNQTRVELVAEGGEVIDKASGRDVENMSRHVTDLTKWKGKKIFIRLVDEGKGGWGHVNFDDFVFHDSAPMFAEPKAEVTGARTMARNGRQTESAVLWHLRPNPLKTATPVAKGSAQEVLNQMHLVDGFQAELVAQEPDVRQPVAFAFDERGRIWVAQALSYPNKQPDGKGKDSIVIFEDTTGNGKFDKRTVFTEGLNLVSGIEVGFGGVWVGAAPQLLFIPDKDHDDKPDGPPEVLLDGFGYQDTHETINSFTWGPDGWLYANQGVFNLSYIGKPGTAKAERTELRAGIWRYHPTRHEFDVFAHGCSNQWGLDFDSRGNLFATHCRSFHGGGGTSYIIRNGHYWNQTNTNYGPYISNTGPAFAPHLKNYLPAAAKYDDGTGGAGKKGTDEVYGGHAHVGTMIYLGDNWPEIYRDHIFTHNIFGQQFNHQEITRDGAGFEILPAGYDFGWDPDPSYLPVDLQYGPDGAAYVIDWCDKQHCHTPNDEKWDRSNGRIYRISWAKTYKPVKVDLGKMSDVELAQLQTHKNEWLVRMGRKVLMERAAKGKIDQSAAIALSDMTKQSDEVALLRGMWGLNAIDKLGGNDPAVSIALSNGSETVRSWAVRLAPLDSISPPNVLGIKTFVKPVQLAQTDKSPTVRLALASALPSLNDTTRWETAEALALHAEDKDDRFLPKMIWFGIAPLVEKNLKRAFELAGKTAMPSLADSIYWYACRFPEGREQIINSMAMAKTTDDALLRDIQLLSFGLSEQANLAMPQSWPAAAERLQKHPNAEARALADQVSVLFGDKAMLAKMRTLLADEKTPLAERKRAFDLLKRANDPEAMDVYAGLLDNDAFRSQVLPLLTRSKSPAAANGMISRLGKFTEADRAAALNTLSSQTEMAAALLKGLEDKTVDRNFVTAFHIRQMLNLNNVELTARIEKLWGKISETPAETKAAIVKFKKAFNEAPLWAFDANNGKKTYEKTCSTCHSMQGVGGKIGPDLGGSWRNGVDYFLDNIVDPNAVVGEQYRLHMAKRNDGTVVQGMFDSETDSVLTIRTPEGNVVIQKADLKQHVVKPESVMPTGLLEAMPQRDVIELLKYLTSKR